jgi:hypothetical protein
MDNLIPQGKEMDPLDPCTTCLFICTNILSAVKKKSAFICTLLEKSPKHILSRKSGL